MKDDPRRKRVLVGDRADPIAGADLADRAAVERLFTTATIALVSHAVAARSLESGSELPGPCARTRSERVAVRRLADCELSGYLARLWCAERGGGGSPSEW